MNKMKKLNGSMIAAVVLSVLLIMSVTAGATLAWFASRDSASASLVMGDAVIVTIGEDYKQGDGKLNMAMPVDTTTGGLLPGMTITPNIKVQLQKSNTNALLRARFITTVEYPDDYEDAAYTDATKYPNMTGYVAEASGKVLADYPVYAGNIHYDYYNFQGEKVEEDGVKLVEAGEYSKTVFLKRVLVRDTITIDSTVTINGTSVVVDEENIAELEIRQRGVDLTNAINKVLSGERGYVRDPKSGEPVLSDTQGIKYSRKVADGWAYRQADQAWYYLGSSTNGFVLENQAGTDETVTATKIANDITAYTETKIGESNVTVQRPTYTVLTKADTDTYDRTRNYLGTRDDSGVIELADNETAVLKQASMASIDLSQGNVSIDFLTKKFLLPTFIDNSYAKAEVTFNFTVEAIQDYLIDPLQEATAAADRVPNNLVNAILVFNNAFPQSLADTGENALAATGAVANIVPSGGTTIGFDQESGKATVTGGTQILDTEAINASGIQGYALIADEYGDMVADYTKRAPWQRGTASSNGISPLIEGIPLGS